MSIQAILDWFAGDGRYMKLSGCMNHDTFWIAATITLDALVAIGYVRIAILWQRAQQHLPTHNPARKSLSYLRNIFVLCGLCGYVFIPIKMYWPAWRLYDMFMVALVYSTWRYALRASNLQVVYTQLERTDKLVAELDKTREENKHRTFFLNAVSHDLRTPLNGLVLQAAVAEMSLDHHDESMLRESLTQMKSTARVAADLLNRLLELGRLDGQQNASIESEFDLAPMVDEVIRRHRNTADQKSLSLSTDVSSRLRLRSDPLKLSRILDNLLANAITFTQAGHITVAAKAVGRSLTLSVIDTGIGIAPEHVPHLFDEFFQVENVERNHVKGFGLGLSIVRRLSDQLGARVHVDSRVGSGSQFDLVLDDCLVEQPAREAAGPRSAPSVAVG